MLNNFDWDVSSGMAAGISGGGRGLAAGIEQMGNELKRAKAYRSMAVDALGMDPDQVDNMSLPDLEGIFMGQALKKSREAEQRQQDFSNQIMQMMSPGAGVPTTGTGNTDFNPQDFMRAAAATGTLTPDLALKMMREGADWGNLMPHEFTTSSGLRGVYGKGGQFQFDPTQFMQDSPELITEDGQRFMRNPRGGWTSVGKSGPVQLPATFQTKVDGLEEQLRQADTNLALTDEDVTKRFPAYKKPEQISAFRDRQKADRENALKSAKSLFDRYQSEGYGQPETWQQLRQTFELEPGKASSQKPAATNQPAATDRVVIEKDGKQFTVPRSQLESARKQGYNEVKAK